MKINVCSLFRDSQHWYGHDIKQVDRYFNQLYKQEAYLKKEINGFSHFNFFAGEKDSMDNTREVLNAYKAENANIEIIDTQSSGSQVESTYERVKNLSKVANSLLNASLRKKADYTLWIESDLILNRDDVVFEFVKKLESEENAAMIAPIVWCETAPRSYFYDTWGFVCSNGTPWRNKYPFNINYLLSNSRYMNMKSIGSCVLAKNLFVKENHFGEDCFRDFSKKTIENGGKIFVDKDIEIYHPSQHYVKKRQI